MTLLLSGHTHMVIVCKLLHRECTRPVYNGLSYRLSRPRKKHFCTSLLAAVPKSVPWAIAAVASFFADAAWIVCFLSLSDVLDEAVSLSIFPLRSVAEDRANVGGSRYFFWISSVSGSGSPTRGGIERGFLRASATTTTTRSRLIKFQRPFGGLSAV